MVKNKTCNNDLVHNGVIHLENNLFLGLYINLLLQKGDQKNKNLLRPVTYPIRYPQDILVNVHITIRSCQIVQKI